MPVLLKLVFLLSLGESRLLKLLLFWILCGEASSMITERLLVLFSECDIEDTRVLGRLRCEEEGRGAIGAGVRRPPLSSRRREGRGMDAAGDEVLPAGIPSERSVRSIPSMFFSRLPYIVRIYEICIYEHTPSIPPNMITIVETG
jgi:hypothetical protein